MPSFDEAWTVVAVSRDGEPVSPNLRPFLQAVYKETLSRPVNVVSLKNSLESLLEFLTGDGRTNANCWATDLFFANCQEWEGDWADRDLPENLHDVLTMMGEALHDTVKDPGVARNFGCLPEQLLEQLKRLPNG
jgi:hypothetical protein